MKHDLDFNEGEAEPLGFSIKGKGSNFCVFSSSAKKLFLGLFRDTKLTIKAPMIQTGNIWHIGINNLPPGFEYAYQIDSSDKWLMDPYAKMIGEERALAKVPPFFDWENDRSPNLDKSDLVIYEMHVRGFTQDLSSKTSSPGTFLGVIEKIPYLKKLGINAIQLMPIFNFQKKNVQRKAQLLGV